MTSSITVEPYETVEFPDSDTDSWQVVDPCDSDNDDVITTESDVVSSSDEEGEDVDEEDEDEDEDVDIDDVIASESDVISSDEDEDDEEEDDDDVITSEEEEEEEDDDVIISEDEEDDVDEITNHTQELNKGYELDGLMNGEGYLNNVEISDVMKEAAYFEHMQLQQRMLDEDDVEEEQEQEQEDEDEDEYDEDLDDELVPRWLNNKFERQRMRKLGKKVYPKMKKSKRMVNQYNRPGCAGAKHGLGLNNNLVW